LPVRTWRLAAFICVIAFSTLVRLSTAAPIDDLKSEVATRIEVINSRTALLARQADLANALLRYIRSPACADRIEQIQREGSVEVRLNLREKWLQAAYVCRAWLRDSSVEIEALRDLAKSAAEGVVGSKAIPPGAESTVSKNIELASVAIRRLDKAAEELSIILALYVPTDPAFCRKSGSSIEAVRDQYIATRNSGRPAAMRRAVVKVQSTYSTIRSRAIFCASRTYSVEAYKAWKILSDVLDQTSRVEPEVRAAACRKIKDSPYAQEACLQGKSSLESDAVLDAALEQKPRGQSQ